MRSARTTWSTCGKPCLREATWRNRTIQSILTCISAFTSWRPKANECRRVAADFLHQCQIVVAGGEACADGRGQRVRRSGVVAGGAIPGKGAAAGEPSFAGGPAHPELHLRLFAGRAGG